MEPVARHRDGNEWDEYVLGNPLASSYHLWGWQKVLGTSLGHRPIALSVKSNGRLTGVLPLIHMRRPLLGDLLVSLPFVNYGGILADDPATRSSLETAALQLAQQLNVRSLELRQRSMLAGLALPAHSSRVTLSLELPDQEAQLWKSIGSKLRNQVRKGDREGLQVRRGGIEALDGFYTVFLQNMHELGSPVWPKRFFRAVLETFPERARVYVAQVGDLPIAAGLILRFQQTVEIPWASSLREHNHLCANVRLYWEMMRDATLEGYRCFDFGRSAPDSGTYHFKRRWGAQEQPLFWHRWPASTDTAGGGLERLRPELEQRWQSLPLWSTRVLGPPLRRLLPQ